MPTPEERQENRDKMEAAEREAIREREYQLHRSEREEREANTALADLRLRFLVGERTVAVNQQERAIERMIQGEDAKRSLEVQGVLQRAADALTTGLDVFDTAIRDLAAKLNKGEVTITTGFLLNASQQRDLQLLNRENEEMTVRIRSNKARFAIAKERFIHRGGVIRSPRSVDAQQHPLSGAEIWRLVQLQRHELANGFGGFKTGQPWMASTAAPSLAAALHLIE